jgi:hypothetical protein
MRDGYANKRFPHVLILSQPPIFPLLFCLRFVFPLNSYEKLAKQNIAAIKYVELEIKTFSKYVQNVCVGYNPKMFKQSMPSVRQRIGIMRPV